MSPTPMFGANLSRRRFISIAAAAAGTAGLPRWGAASEGYRSFSWRGVVLGAEATLRIVHHHEGEARSAIAASLAEVSRLEKIFSLFDADSALARLNRTGRIEDAPADLRILLAQALRLAEETDGAFDPTVQSLWSLYRQHFSTPGADPSGPPEDSIERARGLTGWRHVTIDAGRISLGKPGMALTLNGIAQGYVTDRVGDLLRLRGLKHVLVDMGEQLALGPKGDGSGWRVGIEHPTVRGRVLESLAITSGAVATSARFGTTFDGAHRVSHILDPRTGRPATRGFAAVSVLSDAAALADGLSTALSVLPVASAPDLIRGRARAFVLADEQGTGHWL